MRKPQVLSKMQQRWTDTSSDSFERWGKVALGKRCSRYTAWLNCRRSASVRSYKNLILMGPPQYFYRWSVELERLHQAKHCLIGNCLLSAGFLAYTGPFSWEFRTEMVYEDWFNSLIAKEIPLVSSFRLENELTNDVTISKYVQNSSSSI